MKKYLQLLLQNYPIELVITGSAMNLHVCYRKESHFLAQNEEERTRYKRHAK
mgnify:CR=1 FL=1